MGLTKRLTDLQRHIHSAHHPQLGHAPPQARPPQRARAKHARAVHAPLHADYMCVITSTLTPLSILVAVSLLACDKREGDGTDEERGWGGCAAAPHPLTQSDVSCRRARDTHTWAGLPRARSRLRAVWSPRQLIGDRHMSAPPPSEVAQLQLLAERIETLSDVSARHVLINIAKLSPSLCRLVTDSVDAVVAGMQQGIPTDGAVLGKNKSWSEMVEAEHNAALMLGFDGPGWDAGAIPETCTFPWNRLSTEEQRAALLLGYTATAWDDELETDGVAGAPSGTDPVSAQAASGQPTMTHMPAPVAAPVAAPVPPPVPGRAVALDGTLWEAMTDAERMAATIIGFDEPAWNNGDVPETCKNPWRQLAQMEQDAAVLLGYSADDWDAELSTTPIGDLPAVAAELPAVSAPAPAPAPAPARQPAPPRAVKPPVIGSEGGMMFGCKNDTYDENMRRRLFGLPRQHMDKVNRIGESTALFLFNYSTRKLHGVFVRNGAGGLNLEPDAWAHHRKSNSPPGSPYVGEVDLVLRRGGLSRSARLDLVVRRGWTFDAGRSSQPGTRHRSTSSRSRRARRSQRACGRMCPP